MVSHQSIIIVRIVFAILIAAALPKSHEWWGASPEAAGIEGPSAFVLQLMIVVFSVFVAVVYFAIGSVVQFVARSRIAIAAYFDVCVGVVLIAFLVYGGITAEYHAV